MNNYKIVKNEDWKEVEVNGEYIDVPSNWNIEKLKNKTKIHSGGTPSKETGFYNGNIPWITTTDLNFSYVKNTQKTITELGLSKSSAKLIGKNTILFSMYGASIGKMGISYCDATTNQSIACIIPNKDIHFKYLYYSLFAIRLKIANLGIGNGQPNISQETLKEFEHIFPPVEQQSAIATILSKQEQIISNLETLIKKLELRFQYVSDELLSGRIRAQEENGKTILYKNTEWKEVEVNGEMTEIPSDWEVETPMTLNYNIQTGKKDANAAKFDGNYPFFTCAANQVFKIDTFSFDTEAILISGNGSTLGEVKYFKGKFDAYQRTYILDNISDIDFIFLYFKKNFKESLNIIGGSIPFIKLNDISNFSIIYPKVTDRRFIKMILNLQHFEINNKKLIIKKQKEKMNWLQENLLNGNYTVKE